MGATVVSTVNIGDSLCDEHFCCSPWLNFDQSCGVWVSSVILHYWYIAHCVGSSCCLSATVWTSPQPSRVDISVRHRHVRSPLLSGKFAGVKLWVILFYYDNNRLHLLAGMLTAFGVILKVKVSILATYYGLRTIITVQSLWTGSWLTWGNGTTMHCVACANVQLDLQCS